MGAVEALARPGFDPTRHDLSLLANGEWGWIHITLLLLMGLLTGASATATKAGAENGYIGTLSDVPEYRRKADHDDRRPHGVDRQVIRLPPFEARERSTPSQKADVEHGGSRQIDQKNHVLTQGGHAVRGEAELGDARGDGPQRYRVGQ